MELIYECPLVFFSDGSYAVRELLQGLVVSRKSRFALFIVVEGLWSYPSGSNFCSFGLVCHPLQAVHVRFESLIGEFAIGTIIHTEVDGHGGRFMQQDIASEPGVAADGAITTDTDVAEGDFPVGKTGDCPHLDVIRVEVLFGDTVTDHDDSVPVTEEEVFGKDGVGSKTGDQCEAECLEVFFHRRFRWVGNSLGGVLQDCVNLSRSYGGHVVATDVDKALACEFSYPSSATDLRMFSTDFASWMRKNPISGKRVLVSESPVQIGCWKRTSPEPSECSRR